MSLPAFRGYEVKSINQNLPSNPADCVWLQLWLGIGEKRWFHLKFFGSQRELRCRQNLSSSLENLCRGENTMLSAVWLY